MKRAKKRHSSLFLIELMIALLFFSLAAAICIQFFIQAHLLSQRAENLNEAVLIANSLAEEFRATNGDMVETQFFYDQNWGSVDANNAVFTTTFTITPKEQSLLQANITVFQDPLEPIYELEVIICP